MKYVVKEAPCDENGAKIGGEKVIATDLTEADADAILGQLYASDRLWWKEPEPKKNEKTG